MARNSEKHFVGLNRIFLEKQWKKDRERKRPHLSTLDTAGDVKKWIPSIKSEMNYCVEQLCGARKHKYTDTKLKEFEERLRYLEKEYSRFVHKVLQHEPDSKNIPWTARPYTRNTIQEPNEGKHDELRKRQQVQIDLCQDLLDETQEWLSDEENKELSPVLSRKECVSEQTASLVEIQRPVTLEEDNSKACSCTTDNNSAQSLVSYDLSDSDET